MDLIIKPHLRFTIILISLITGTQTVPNRVPCYDEHGRAQRCFPPFVNAAFNLPVEATDTCGGFGETPQQEYFCKQTAGATKSCDVCDAADPTKVHPPSYLTDFHRVDNLTWWQSSTMLERVQWPHSVNLTLSLGKAFEITYIRLKFHSSRPESFAIYRRRLGGETSEWTPYQFYSSSCEQTYGIPRTTIITREDEAKATCRDDFSDISPLTGGSVAFSTLEGRPGAYDFENSPALNDWVTATDIKVVLNRINTFRDEVFGDPNVLRSYYYAISDFAIGGRCKCNGHSSECVDLSVESRDDGLRARDDRDRARERNLVCRCEHYTMGRDCELCQPFYNDQPWRQATSRDAYECKPCNCNGKSNKCFFDAELYARTGHGGHCEDCSDNAAGVHCEECREGYYRLREGQQDPYHRDAVEGQCLPCFCHPEGSESLQCDVYGTCRCKAGVTGDKCNQCQPNHYELSEQGCRACDCLLDGSEYNRAECDTVSGQCQCKENVQGRKCDECKPGYFALNTEDPLGCMVCFCFGHSTQCNRSEEYTDYIIESYFDLDDVNLLLGRGSASCFKTYQKDITSGIVFTNLFGKTGLYSFRGNNGDKIVVCVDDEGWRVESFSGLATPLIHEADSRSVTVYDNITESIYFIAPSIFLGDKRLSYNRYLTFQLRVEAEGPPRVSVADLVLEGADIRVSAPIFAQSNPSPTADVQEYAFRLNEHERLYWSPRLPALDFIRMLSNLTAIKIRATYGGGGEGRSYLSSVKLQSAEAADHRSGSTGGQSMHVEQCTCPQGYVGQFCEFCDLGYHRDQPNGGPLSQCRPCQCHGHSETCDLETGKCNCEHYTTGHHCESCLPGFYGFATIGNETDCKKCPCPDGVNCVELLGGEVSCFDCPVGYTGSRCHLCDDGYYGDLNGTHGNENQACQLCGCSNNIDANAVGNCDSVTGECLRCLYNTGGPNCSSCLPGHYGNATALPHGQCEVCGCSLHGSFWIDSSLIQCDLETGQCPCRENVIGRKCDSCEPGFWNIRSENGCEECGCDVIGSLNNTCDVTTGQCHCKPNVGGLKCDRCLKNFYNLTSDGCSDCECSRMGSVSLQCDPETGICPCRVNVIGRHCDQCDINKYNVAAGCIDCPRCYNNVQKEVESLKGRVHELRDVIHLIKTTPPAQENDTEFIEAVEATNQTIREILELARQIGNESEGVEIFFAITAGLGDISLSLRDINVNTEKIFDHNTTSSGDISATNLTLIHAEAVLSNAEQLLYVNGMGALNRSKEVLENHGSHSEDLTSLANEARELSKRQESEADLVEKIAEEALNTTQEAMRIASEALEKLRHDEHDMTLTNRRIEDLGEQLGAANERANNSLIESRKLYKESLEIFASVDSLQIPRLSNDSDLTNQTSRISEEALSISKEAEDFTHEWTIQRDSLDGAVHQTREALRQAKDLQEVQDELLARANESLKIAHDAFDKSEMILSEADMTLKRLEDFDQNVRESREQSEDALKKIPEIETMILDADSRVRDASNGLPEADHHAEFSERLSSSALNITVKLAQDMLEISTMAEISHNFSLNLEYDSEQLQEEVDDLENRIRELEKVVTQDSSLIEKALEDADIAKSDTTTSQEKLAGALSTVNTILERLDKLDTLDNTELDKLEGLLEDAERELTAGDIDRRFTLLAEMETQMKSWVRDYTMELIELEKDVENVRQINATIPQTCYKKISLEPEEAVESWRQYRRY